MKTMSLGQVPAHVPDPNMVRFEATSVLIGGLVSAAGMILLATRREREGYAVLIAVAVASSALAATRILTTR